MEGKKCLWEILKLSCWIFDFILWVNVGQSNLLRLSVSLDCCIFISFITEHPITVVRSIFSLSDPIYIFQLWQWRGRERDRKKKNSDKLQTLDDERRFRQVKGKKEAYERENKLAKKN